MVIAAAELKPRMEAMEAKKNLSGREKQEGGGGPKSGVRKATGEEGEGGSGPKSRDRKAAGEDGEGGGGPKSGDRKVAGEKGGVGGSTPKDQVGTYFCTKATGTCKVSVLN